MPHAYKYGNDIETFDEAAIWGEGIAKNMNALRKRLLRIEKLYLKAAHNDAFLATRMAMDHVQSLEVLCVLTSEDRAVKKLGITRRTYRAARREYIETRTAIGRLLRIAQIREQGYVLPYDHVERDCDKNGVPVIPSSARELLSRRAEIVGKIQTARKVA